MPRSPAQKERFYGIESSHGGGVSGIHIEQGRDACQLCGLLFDNVQQGELSFVDMPTWAGRLVMETSPVGCRGTSPLTRAAVDPAAHGPHQPLGECFLECLVCTEDGNLALRNIDLSPLRGLYP